MGPGFKYHVVTVAAIFFALTVGLVVGSLFISSQVVRSQSNLLKSLSTKVNQDIKDRDLELAHYHKFLAVVMPRAIRGVLNGRKVAIVLVGDYPEVATPLRETLETAGAQVTCLLSLDRNFDKPDELLLPRLAQLHEEDARIPKDRTGLALTVANLLVHGESAANPVLPVLDRADLVRVEANNESLVGASDVVFVAGSRVEGSNRPGNVDLPLISALQNLGARVVMCEPESALVSDVPAYHALNIDVGTVDNIDSDIGRYTLISLLEGAKDDYGVKPTAKDLMPPVAN